MPFHRETLKIDITYIVFQPPFLHLWGPSHHRVGRPGRKMWSSTWYPDEVTIPSLWRCAWSPSWSAAPAWWSPPGPPSCSSSGCPQPRSPGSSWSRRTGSGRRRNREPENVIFTHSFFKFMTKTYLNLHCLGQCWGYNLAKQDRVLQYGCRGCYLQNTRGIRHPLIS